jgi:hypothetical protein
VPSIASLYLVKPKDVRLLQFVHIADDQRVSLVAARRDYGVTVRHVENLSYVFAMDGAHRMISNIFVVFLQLLFDRESNRCKSRERSKTTATDLISITYVPEDALCRVGRCRFVRLARISFTTQCVEQTVERTFEIKNVYKTAIVAEHQC